MSEPTYLFGSTAYEFSTAAPSLPRRNKEEKENRKEYAEKVRDEIEQRVRERKSSVAAFSFSQILVFFAAAVICCAIAVMYVSELSSLYSSKTKISDLQKQYQVMAQENTMKENRLSKRINYEEVYRYATEELHMSVPEKQQMICYQQAEDEYVVNRGEIPNE